MKPYIKLTKEGTKIFNNIVDHVKDAGRKEIDTYLLSILADAFDEYNVCVADIRKNGFRNNHDQLSPAVSTRDKALNTIIKLSPLFGIDIKNRESLSAFSEEKEEVDPLEEALK